MSEEPLTFPATPGEGEANLPAVPADDELVLDGEIVGAPGPQPRVYVLRPVVQVFQSFTVVVRHEHTKTVARHAAYVPAGLVVLARRRRHGGTLAARMARQAEMAGDHPNALLWARHEADQRHRRHERLVALVRLTPLAGAITLCAMVALSILLAFKEGLRGLLWPWETAAGIAVTLVSVASALSVAAMIAFPLVAFVVLHELGRRDDHAPGWARTAAEDDIDHEVTELLLTNALANLRIPQVRDYLKLGMPLQFVTGCRQEGRGTFAAIRLPGVPAERVVRRRGDLAAGVHRAAKEVWPSVGGEAAILNVWIADKGALEEGAGLYPLLGEGFADVFKGLPFGKTLRGDPIKIPVIGRNSICGGAPEQGKSNSARVVACGYALDISTELRIYVPDANFDFDWFKPRCSRYLVGAEDEVIEQMLEEQELLKEEIQNRGNLLRDYEMQEVTREIAHAGVGLHPVFILVEEAHVPITHRKHGKDFGQLLGENVKLCRKRGMHIFVSTQAPVRGAMPRDVTTNCTNGIAHAVSDIYANDALLGPGAHSSGHRATELLIPADRGTALCKGFGGEARSEMVQVHRIQASRDSEQVTPIVKRALAAMAEQGRAVPGTERGPLAIVARDLLDDLAAVIDGPARVKVNDLPQRLRRLAPGYAEYRSLNGVQLRERLMAEDVRTVKAGNVPLLDPADLRSSIAARESEG